MVSIVDILSRATDTEDDILRKDFAYMLWVLDVVTLETVDGFKVRYSPRVGSIDWNLIC